MKKFCEFSISTNKQSEEVIFTRSFDNKELINPAKKPKNQEKQKFEVVVTTFIFTFINIRESMSLDISTGNNVYMKDTLRTKVENEAKNKLKMSHYVSQKIVLQQVDLLKINSFKSALQEFFHI